MFKIKQQPYHVLLLSAVLLLVASFFVLNQSNTVDIYLHDTYFVIAHMHVFWLSAFAFLFLWVLYLLTGRFLYSKTLTWTHLIITLLTGILLVFALYFSNDVGSSMPRRYDQSTWQSYDKFGTLAKTVAFSITSLLFGQVIFIVNLIAGLIRK